MTGDERSVLTTHVEAIDGTLTFIEVDAEGNLTASQCRGVILVVDLDGRLTHLRHLDTTHHYDEDDDDE